MIIWKGNKAFLGERNLGRIEFDYFVSDRNTKDHYFRIFKGWGFNKELIEDLKKKKILQFRLLIDNGRKILVTNLTSIRFKGKDYQAEEYEPQWILPELEFDNIYEQKIGELNKYIGDKT